MTGRNSSICLIAFFMCITFLITADSTVPAMAGNPDQVRKPAVSGRFYTASPEKLKNGIRMFLESAESASGKPPSALIAPHAGYIYSGQIAADAFHQAEGFEYDVVVILGTNHTSAGFGGVSVFQGKGYETPLGTATVDTEISRKLIEAADYVTFDASVHRREHSVEVQVPFIQYIFPDTPIVAVVVSDQDPDIPVKFGKLLALTLKDRRALVVASSDLSHYPTYEEAVKTDHNTLSAIQGMDVKAFRKTLEKQINRGVSGLSTCACGEEPIATAMTFAEAVSADCVRIVSYANSGDSPLGDPGRVVGYGAVSFSRNDDCDKAVPEDRISESTPEGEWTREHEKQLLAFARQSIAQFLLSETVPPARGFDPVLTRKQGAFVTLHKKGRLRGCIGHMSEDTPLCAVVGAMAIQAAFNDRRFRPLKPEELNDIDIEISVLTPFTKVSGPEAVIIGKHGTLLRKNGRSAVFLPQVAPEQGWRRDEMFEHLCLKAGLSKNAWKKGAEIFTFEAVVFGEKEFHGR